MTVIEKAGLHLHRYPAPGLTLNRAVWGKKGENFVYRLEANRNTGNLDRIHDLTDPEGLIAAFEDWNSRGGEDFWIPIRMLPAGWYEATVGPTPGHTRGRSIYFEVERYESEGGHSQMRRVMDDRRRLKLIMLRGWN